MTLIYLCLTHHATFPKFFPATLYLHWTCSLWGLPPPIFFLFVFYPFWLQAFNYFPANPSHEFPHPMVSSALYYPLKPFSHWKLLPRVGTFVTTRALKVKDVLLNNHLAFLHPFLSFSTWSLYSRIIVFISLIFISEFLLE